MQILYVLNVIAASVVKVFMLVLTVYCVSSWFIRDPFDKFMVALEKVVGPVLDPIRNLLRRVRFLDGFPLDLSVVIAYIICSILLHFLGV